VTSVEDPSEMRAESRGLGRTIDGDVKILIVDDVFILEKFVQNLVLISLLHVIIEVGVEILDVVIVPVNVSWYRFNTSFLEKGIII